MRFTWSSSRRILRHAIADKPPVGFDLGFTGAAKEAEAAALALKVSPAAHQATCLIVEMCELHLKPALGSRCALAEDFQDQSGAIDHLRPGLFLQILLLDRG